MKYSQKIPITFQQLEGDGFHIFTELKIFDDPYFVLIDTGASKTVFADTVIDKYPMLEIIGVENNMAAGIGEGKVSARMVLFPQICVGRAKLINMHCGSMDFTHINSAYNEMNLKPFDAILGGDILQLLKAEISYKHSYLKIFPQ